MALLILIICCTDNYVAFLGVLGMPGTAWQGVDFQVPMVP